MRKKLLFIGFIFACGVFLAWQGYRTHIIAQTGVFHGTVTMQDDQWIGLGAAKGRIVFDDATVDEVNIMTANFGINEATPDELFHATSSTSNKPMLKIENTNDNNLGGTVSFYKIPTTATNAADDDDLGYVEFRGVDAGDAATRYAYIFSESEDVTAGDEAGNIRFIVAIDNVEADFLTMTGYQGVVGKGHFIVNDDSKDVDFRVESDNYTSALAVDGAAGGVTAQLFNYLADTSSTNDTYGGTMTPAPTALITGMLVVFVPAVANTGACTLAFSGLTVKNIKTASGGDPANNDIVTTTVSLLVYDGTNWVLINPATTCD